jgi:hypothetical protein
MRGKRYKSICPPKLPLLLALNPYSTVPIVCKGVYLPHTGIRICAYMCACDYLLWLWRF